MANNTELQKLVESQQKEINTLKKAVALLERRLKVVSASSYHVKVQANRVNEEVRILSSKVGKG